MKKIIFAVSLSIAACTSYSDSEKIARQFVDFYYVSATLPKAQMLADGLALQKINDSLALREGQPIDESTRRPKISYKLLEKNEAGDDAHYLFQITIKPPDFEEMRKRSRLHVKNRDGQWKVTQFSDHED